MASVSTHQNSLQDTMSGQLDQTLTVSSSKSQSLKGIQYEHPDTDTQSALKQQLLQQQQQQQLATPVHEGQPLKQPQAATNGAAQHVPEHLRAALPDAAQPHEQPKQVIGPHTMPGPEQQTWQAPVQQPLVQNDTAMFQPPAAQSIPAGPHHPAAPQVAPMAAPMARTAEAAVGPGGCLLESIYTRPCIERSDRVCSCPMVCAGKLGRLMPLPVSDMTFSVSCHLNYAFVHLQLVCEVPSHASVSRETVYFFMPKAPDTIVTELRADNMTTNKAYPSQVVSVDALRGRKRVSGASLPEPDMDANQAKRQGQLQAEQSELLRLDFNAERGDRLSVSLQYFHPLHFDASTGDYVLQLPTTIPQECLNGADMREILKVSVTVHTGTATAAQWAAVEPESNFPVVCLPAQGGAVEFRANKARVWPQQDLILRYQLPADNITADMQVLPSPSGGESFMLSLMPPDRDSAHARRTFPRDVVFLFDRSSSMDGNPLLRAKAALMAGLQKTLHLQDRFTVAAFNEGQQWWQESLVDATPQNLVSCQRWVSEHITAEGQTDIRQPLMKALQLLRSAPPGLGAGPRLPTVFLIVDGSVKDEQEICEQAQRLIATPPVPIIESGVPQRQQQQQPQQQQPRIFTFGIGSFCNHYFLKTLAVIGRGMYRGAFNVNSIQQVMSELLDAAAMPMLTNVSVTGSNLANLYPAPIPDLCLGQPLLVAGEFMGHSPPSVSVQGLMTGHTAPVEVCVQPRPARGTGLQYVLEKIMVHHKLEVMAAQAWRLCEVNKARHQQLCQEIKSLSVKHNIPVSNYTVMLSYETDKAAMDQLQGKPASDMAQHALEHGWNLWVVGGVAAAVGVGSVAATVAGVAVGAAMVAGEFGGGCEFTECECLLDLVSCCGP